MVFQSTRLLTKSAGFRKSSHTRPHREPSFVVPPTRPGPVGIRTRRTVLRSFGGGAAHLDRHPLAWRSAVPDGIPPTRQWVTSWAQPAKATTMPLPVWQLIPPATPVRDLYRTSLLACTDDPSSGILLRCGAGLEDGSATLVHAPSMRPDALTMTSVDDDTQIAAQAQLLLGNSTVHVVAIPHITWKNLGGGLPRRTPIAAAIALLVAVVLFIPPLSMSAWVALSAGVGLGLLTWLLLRERVPTRIGPSEAPMAADAVVERVMLTIGREQRQGKKAGRPATGTARWAPPVG